MIKIILFIGMFVIVLVAKHITFNIAKIAFNSPVKAAMFRDLFQDIFVALLITLII